MVLQCVPKGHPSCLRVSWSRPVIVGPWEIRLRWTRNLVNAQAREAVWHGGHPGTVGRCVPHTEALVLVVQVPKLTLNISYTGDAANLPGQGQWLYKVRRASEPGVGEWMSDWSFSDRRAKRAVREVTRGRKICEYEHHSSNDCNWQVVLLDGMLPKRRTASGSEADWNNSVTGSNRPDVVSGRERHSSNGRVRSAPGGAKPTPPPRRNCGSYSCHGSYLKHIKPHTSEQLLPWVTSGAEHRQNVVPPLPRALSLSGRCWAISDLHPAGHGLDPSRLHKGIGVILPQRGAFSSLQCELADPCYCISSRYVHRLVNQYRRTAETALISAQLCDPLHTGEPALGVFDDVGSSGINCPLASPIAADRPSDVVVRKSCQLSGECRGEVYPEKPRLPPETSATFPLFETPGDPTGNLATTSTRHETREQDCTRDLAGTSQVDLNHVRVSDTLDRRWNGWRARRQRGSRVDKSLYSNEDFIVGLDSAVLFALSLSSENASKTVAGGGGAEETTTASQRRRRIMVSLDSPVLPEIPRSWQFATPRRSNTTLAEKEGCAWKQITALIHVKDSSGQFKIIRALFDGASQTIFITENCVQRLGLKCDHECVEFAGSGQTAVSGARKATHYFIKPMGPAALILPSRPQF
ncbi:hypothetical protein PR048_009678 [Dryococelus australis]|uniref:Uncharacterized protein n=1 Tax=Dryococelus australis TaxID=614101 RepID=A0ABQ9I0K2_9NEOP|nr:hypothetical protein PR048_009678 [Dryococelus australis]